MLSFPYYSHIFRDFYGSGMGRVWVRGPILGGPWKSHWPISWTFQSSLSSYTQKLPSSKQAHQSFSRYGKGLSVPSRNRKHGTQREWCMEWLEFLVCSVAWLQPYNWKFHGKVFQKHQAKRKKWKNISWSFPTHPKTSIILDALRIALLTLDRHVTQGMWTRMWQLR